MSAGMNVAWPATPIDLETVRRNLREVMTNLRLLENGDNVRVEDLVRQARENLDRNRRFILRIGQNQGNRNIANDRNENMVVPNQVERIPVVPPVPPPAEEEQQPERVNPPNNAEEQVADNQRDNEEQNVPLNGDNDPVINVTQANRLREWAERYERDWNQFRQPTQIAAETVVRNMQFNNPVERNPPTVVHIRLPGGAANDNAEPVGIIRNNNDNNGARARPANYEFPRCLFGAIRHRPPRGPDGLNMYPMAQRYANYPPRTALGIPPPPAHLFGQHPRPVAPNQHGTLEERIAFLQDRLDRLEDGRFYEYMIEEGGHQRIRDMIGRLRRRLIVENVQRAPATLCTRYANGFNPGNHLNAEANQDGAGQLMMPPPRRDIPQCFGSRAEQLAHRALDQTIKQPNSAVKRQNAAWSSRETNAEQVSTPKRPRVQENLPGTSSDPGPSQRNNDNAIAGPSNHRRNSLDVDPGNAQNILENSDIIACHETDKTLKDSDKIPKEVKDKGKRLKKHKKKDRSKKDKKKKRPENNLVDQLSSTSSENVDLQTNTDWNNIEDGKDNEINLPVVEDPDENVPAAENIPGSDEESQQDPNADVIIVSAFFPTRIKVERNDDDNNDNNCPNNCPNQRNAAQNRANRQNDNCALQEPRIVPRRAPRRVDMFPQAFREVPVPFPPEDAPRGVEDGIIDVRRAIEDEAGVDRIINYARAVMNVNAPVRGPNLLGILDRPFLTLENMVEGLQTFITNEVREGNRRPQHARANEIEENQLLMVQTYVRLRRELREIIFNTERLGMRGYKMGVLQGQIILWFKIVGPPGTAYDRAEISIRIRMNLSQWRQYSEVRMAHRIWHPNMCPFTGHILPIYPWNNWTLFKILACIRRLLIIPELDNTTHDAVARQYQTHREIFNRTAQHWTSVYGRGGRNDNLAIPEYAELLERLVEEGIPKDRALHLLSKNNWDIDKAMEEIG